jgi:hypothetical protein
MDRRIADLGGSATGQRPIGNGRNCWVLTGSVLGSKEPDGNTWEAPSGACHAEGRGFEPFHPLPRNPPEAAGFLFPHWQRKPKCVSGQLGQQFQAANVDTAELCPPAYWFCVLEVHGADGIRQSQGGSPSAVNRRMSGGWDSSPERVSSRAKRSPC